MSGRILGWSVCLLGCGLLAFLLAANLMATHAMRVEAIEHQRHVTEELKFLREIASQY